MRIVIFDMDGVLVDPAESYRRATIETVRHFSGQPTTNERIIEIKNDGGYNDDADVALRILREMGHEVSREEIVDVGDRLFWGENRDGMVLGERWLASDGLLERIGARASLAIFTGRGMRDAAFSLERFCPSIRFASVMTAEQVENLKPAPDGLLKIIEATGAKDPIYVGDNVDDARAARAAGVPFIGVAERGLHRREDILALFEAEGAQAVVESVNELESLI